MINKEKYQNQLDKLNGEINQLTKNAGLAAKAGNQDEFAQLKIIVAEKQEEKKEILNQWTKENDLKILERCIKKEDLIDGAWYETDFEGKKVARFAGKAKWIEKDNHFLAPGQQQFGMDGYLDYWGDVIESRYAGFPPMKKVD